MSTVSPCDVIPNNTYFYTIELIPTGSFNSWQMTVWMNPGPGNAWTQAYGLNSATINFNNNLIKSTVSFAFVNLSSPSFTIDWSTGASTSVSLSSNFGSNYSNINELTGYYGTTNMEISNLYSSSPPATSNCSTPYVYPTFTLTWPYNSQVVLFNASAFTLFIQSIVLNYQAGTTVNIINLSETERSFTARDYSTDYMDNIRRYF